MLSINYSSKAFKNAVTARIIAGENPADAVKAEAAAIQAANAMKQAAAAASRAIHALKVSEGLRIAAPAALVEAVHAQYLARVKAREAAKIEAKALGLRGKAMEDYISPNVPRYSSGLIFKLAKAWQYEAFTAGACYIAAGNVDLAMRDAGLI